jgi:hypothetical protein
VKQSYFQKRRIRPVASEPMPSNPSRGSGEAVCGSLFWAVWSAALVF